MSFFVCRMKIKECKRKVYSVGFIDPDRVHIHSLTNWPDDTATNLLRFIMEQNYYDHILFPYNFGSGSYSSVHISSLLDVM